MGALYPMISNQSISVVALELQSVSLERNFVSIKQIDVADYVILLRRRQIHRFQW